MIIKKPMKHVSASQVETFRRCRRKWYLQYPLGMKTPTTVAQERGTEIHTLCEDYLRTGILDQHPKNYDKLVTAALPILPKPGKDLLLEFEIALPAFDGGPNFKGFIDVLSPRELPDVLTIRDHKTTSNFKYSKTESELLVNTQAVVYSYWAYSVPTLKQMFPLPPTQPWFSVFNAPYRVNFGHHYINTRDPVPGFTVETDMPYDKVAFEWAKIQEDVKSMVSFQESGLPHLKVVGNDKACNDFGGCPFLKDGTCTDMKGVYKNNKTKSEQSLMGKMDEIKKRLAEKRLQQAKEFEFEAEKCNAGVIETSEGPTRCPGCPNCQTESILPPDASPREQTAQEIAANVEKDDTPAKKAATKRKKAIERVLETVAEPILQELPKPPAAETPPVIQPRLDKQQRVVFLDSLPLQHNICETYFGSAPVPLEVWLDPIKKIVADSFEVPDFGLIDFKSKGALAAAINEQIDSCPPVVFTFSRLRTTDVFLEAALQKGWLIIKGSI